MAQKPAGFRWIRRTLRPVGADASAAVTDSMVAKGTKGVLHSIAIDYTSQPATTDVTIVDAAGRTVFTRANSSTDIALSPTARTGVDETGAATAGVDQPGLPYSGGLVISVAQADGQTTGDETVVVEMLLYCNS